jgi:peptide/nickel transport system permease protein
MQSSTRESATEVGRPRPTFGKRRQYFHVTRRIGIGGLVGILLLVFLTLVAAAGPLFVRNPMQMDVPARLEPPSMAHFFGTDEFGRDIFSRAIYGARISLGAGLGVVSVGLGLGATLGLIAGYRGGMLGVAVMSVVDIMLALPGVLLAIVITALFSPRLSTAVAAVGLVTIPYYARLIWGVTQSVRTRDYVEAARAVGASDGRIIRRHLLPGVIPPAFVQATLGVGNGILTVSALSFLGIGAQPPTPEWGLMLSEAQRFILVAPYMGIFSGLGIALAVLGFNVTGDAMRDLLDPTLKLVVRP